MIALHSTVQSHPALLIRSILSTRTLYRFSLYCVVSVGRLVNNTVDKYLLYKYIYSRLCKMYWQYQYKCHEVLQYQCRYISNSAGWAFYSALQSFANVVCATAYPSVRLSVTLRYCVKTREHRRVAQCLYFSSVSSLLTPRMVDGGRPCPGKSWVQRGRLPLKTAELYTFCLITVIDSRKKFS